MNEIRTRIESGARSRGENLRLILKVKDPSMSTAKKDVFISISDSHFDVYQIGENLSVKAYSWFTLKKIYVKDATICVEFNETKLSFIALEIPNAYEVILDLLPRILTPTELLFAGILPTNSQPKPTPNSAILRLKQKVKYSNNPEQSRAIASIIEAITYSPSEVRLSSLEDQQNAIPLFIDILPLLPAIKSLVIDGSQPIDYFKSVFELTNNSGALEHLEFRCAASPTFDKFFKYLLKNQNSQVVALTFHDVALSDLNLHSLLCFMRKKPLSSISFINSIKSQSLSYFYFTFLADKTISDLVELRLDSTPGLNLYALLPSISYITIFSVENCSLDINKTISKISKMNFPNLTTINLSKNSCKETLSSGLRLPPMLSTIMMNDIEWGEGCLLSFFKLLTANYKKGLRLSISNCDTQRSEWVSVLSYLSTVEAQFLKSFVYNSNFINETFFSFLKKQNDIEYLSLNFCFKEKDTDLLRAFADYLPKANGLNALSIQGNDDFYIGDSVDCVLSSLQHRKSLHYLDMSNSKSGDDGIANMKELLLSQSAPHLLIMDGADPVRSKTILDFLNSVLDCNQDICVSFPKKDLDYLAKLKRLTEEQYINIKERYKISEGNTNHRQFDAPFSIFIEEKIEEFPKYVFKTNYSAKVPNMANNAILQKETSPKLPRVPVTYDGENDSGVESSKSKRLFEYSSPGCSHNQFHHRISTHAKVLISKRPQTMDPEDFQKPTPNQKKSKQYHISSSQLQKTKEIPKKEKTTSREQEKEHLLPLHLPSESSSSWQDRRSQSNIAAVSSQAALSINDEKQYQGKIKKEKVEAKPSGKKAPEGTVSRLTPSDSLARLLQNQRQPLHKQKENDILNPSANSSSSSIPMNARVEQDAMPIREPQRPPPSGSPRRGMKHPSIPLPAGQKAQESGPIAKEIKPPNQFEQSDSSDSLLFTIDTSTPSVPNPNGAEAENQKKEKRHHSKKNKEPETIRGEWTFPIARVKAPEPWKELQSHFSLDENMRVLSKIPHEHFTE